MKLIQSTFAFAVLCTSVVYADVSQPYPLSDDIRTKCLNVLRDGLAADDFWPSIHAAEALSLAGFGDEVREALEPKLSGETDDQKRCGLVRELLRAGDREHDRTMFRILEDLDSNGRVHAAESLYKIKSVGDGDALRQAFAKGDSMPLRMMAAAALAQAGHPEALEFLREKLDHDEPEIAMLAAWVLGRLGDIRDTKAIRRAAGAIENSLARAFFEYALAQLGEAQGRTSAIENLSSDDDAVRTYAAEVCGPARITAAVPQLTEMLDDPAVDARIRAAQSLLTLADAPSPAPHEDISMLVYEATVEHPRYTEGSVVQLNSGDLLYATTEFSETTSDFARAHIIAKTSRDSGRTWSEARELQTNIGQLNVLGTTLRWLPPVGDSPRRLVMLYSVTHSYDNLQTFLKFSTDDGRTFAEPLLVTPHPGYNIIVSDRMTILKTGRIVLPCSFTTDIEKVNHMVCFCYYSDDGQTWHKGTGEVDLPKRGAMEPDVVELRDGRLLMIMRNQLGTISASYSNDAGDTWSEPGTLGDLQAPESPATIRTIPSTGDLLLVWNDTYEPDAGHGGARTPLAAAVSRDDGETWEHRRLLETDLKHTYAYTSLTFIGDRVVLSYWDEDRQTARYSARFRSLPVSWFYENEHQPK